MSRDGDAPRSAPSDGRTLTSILSLAAGAAASQGMPDAGATIITQTFAPVTVGYGASQLESYSLDLPDDGTDDQRLTLLRLGGVDSKTIGMSFDFVRPDDRLGRQAESRSVEPGAYSGVNVAFRTAAGATWNDADRGGSGEFGNIVNSRRVQTSTGPYPSYTAYYASKTFGPGDFSNKYLLFKFLNTSLDTPIVNYGWIHVVSATVSAGNTAQMSVTIDKWAYQDDGSPIAAGAVEPVPEPTTLASLAMGGALVAGASGLRAWRRRRMTAAERCAETD